MAIPFVVRRMSTPPAKATDLDLPSVFREAMFIGIGFSETVALLGFTGVFLTGSMWVYLLSLPFALLGLVRVGPFQRTFERCDQLLQEQGSALRMTEAWRRTSEPDTGRRPW